MSEEEVILPTWSVEGDSVSFKLLGLTCMAFSAKEPSHVLNQQNCLVTEQDL